jgi:transposase InsO family protein
MLVMDVFTRRIIGFGVERASIDGVTVCRMFNHAVAGRLLPRRISTDHDPLFRFHRWLANPPSSRLRKSSRFRTLRSPIRSSKG